MTKQDMNDKPLSSSLHTYIFCSLQQPTIFEKPDQVSSGGRQKKMIYSLSSSLLTGSRKWTHALQLQHTSYSHCVSVELLNPPGRPDSS